MSSIVCVHGIGQQLEGEDSLLRDWLPALRDGVRRAGFRPPEPIEVNIAFYGDLFRKRGTKSFGLPPYDHNDVNDDWEKALLHAWWEESAQIEEAVPGPGADTKLRTPQIVQSALNALSHSNFFADIALNVFIADLKQVSSYFHDDEVRRQAQRRVEAAVTDKTRVIVGHSLGTVVAYEALCHHPDWTVQAYVTLGSLLGIRNLIFDRLRPPPQDGIGRWPGGIAEWTNIADGGDVVALEKDLRSCFGNGVKDLRVHNGAHAHDVRPYLTTEETGNAIAQALVV